MNLKVNGGREHFDIHCGTKLQHTRLHICRLNLGRHKKHLNGGHTGGSSKCQEKLPETYKTQITLE